MARTNFSWGAGGVGKEGVDYGNTNNWNDQQWNDYETKYNIPHPNAQPIDNGPVGTSVGGATPPITTQQQVGSTQAQVGGSIAQGTPTTIAQSFQQALVNKLNPQPLSASSPVVAPAIQANQLSEQRGMEQTRGLLAERAASQGLDQNAFNSQLLGAQGASAGRQGQFAGDAVMRANQEQGMNDRSAMVSAAGLLGGNAGLSQQQQLAELDAAIRREGISSSTALGQGDLALRQRLGEGGLNNQLLSVLLNNDQFGRSLSQNGAQFGAGLDQQGFLALLSGL